MSSRIPVPEFTPLADLPDSFVEIAYSSRVLDRVADHLATQGVVGEERAIKLLYLVLTTRFLGRPVSAVVKGPSSAGKSFAVEKVLSLFPPEAYYWLTAMSEKL